ncbi:hypothetical protein BBJ28_00014035 [Nothophytophthora sp. Chile5]|nr:hypothetical protein BBJ28_00014035 [Nothophytophthora sp. Chile5]
MEKPPTDAPLCEFAEKRGRLFVAKRGQLDVLMLPVHDLLEELAKVEDLSTLSAATSENGAVKIMNGEDRVDHRTVDDLTAHVAQLRDAMVELLENMKTAAASVPELPESCAAFNEEVKEFPAKIADAVINADLGNGEIPKVATATAIASNVQALGNGPKITQAITIMIKYAVARSCWPLATSPKVAYVRKHFKLAHI